MPIHPFSEEGQAPVLHHYNETQIEKNKIPHLLRNYNSGWPLLQVSLFSPNDSVDPIKYEHVLGGGTCHFFYIGAFNFASLLTKIPGKMEIIIPYPITPTRELIKADNVLMFLKAFNIHHKKFGIKIISTSGGYGKNLTIELPMGNAEQLRNTLKASFSFALKEHALIKPIGTWEDSGYTQKQIEDAINPDVAVFNNGQIFIDLGMLLKQKVQDKEINLLFKCLFKVNAFLELTKQCSDFKPDSPAMGGATPEVPEKPLESNFKKRISFFREETQGSTSLDDMEAYGKNLASNQRR